MIIYQASRSTFLEDAFTRNIEDVVAERYSQHTGSAIPPAEMRSWKESLLQMAKVVYAADLPDDVQVAIEYRIPQTSKRVDFLLAGRSESEQRALVIVELKQWSSATATELDGIIRARRGGPSGEREGPHPSYQAWTYAALLEGFNEAIYTNGIKLAPCAYLHNYSDDGVINSKFYKPHLDKAPVFLQGTEERQKLARFIRNYIAKADETLLFEVDQGRIRPSKMLVDALEGMLRGKEEFFLVDDQKLVYERALALATDANRANKQVLIVKGGPGTGKTVVAINLLVAITGRKRVAKYVSKNAAPRAVYEARLTGTNVRSFISGLFSGSGGFIETPTDTFDALVVDEAHRLNEKSGLYANLGENQLKELINAAKTTIFFVDDDQQVTFKDIGTVKEIRSWANKAGATVSELELESQFRCNGSDGYIAWVDHTLQLRTTAHPLLDSREFEFQVLDSPDALHDLVRLRNKAANRARVVAGYCWNWVSKRDPRAFDIEVGAYRKQWNLSVDGSLWIVAAGSIEEIGCIHTCQGLELDYVGVMIGGDLIVRGEKVLTVPKARARTDKSLAGYKKMREIDPEAADARADRIIRNTYRALMTRGMKGCFVWSADEETRAWFRSRISSFAYGARSL